MQSGKLILDKALETRSLYGLAKETEVSIGSLSAMRAGARPVPAKLAGQLAAMVGIDPRDAALSAIVAQEADPGKREKLARLFRLPAAALMLVGALLSPPDSLANQRLNAGEMAPPCILCKQSAVI